MRKLNDILCIAFAAIIISGCGATSKDIIYFQNIDKVELNELTTEYEAIIKKDDRLSIIVSGPDKTVTAPYNLTLSEVSTSANMNEPERSVLTYLVDSKGNIQFPILGTIHVEGMTRNQLEEYLTNEIGRDVKNPIVYVSFRNYKISVLGEVKNPGTYVMDSEKTNILQAIAKAGDLNLTAKRDGIILIREENGKEMHYTLDLRDGHILDSPYFYLQQNDILYIPPSRMRVASANTATGIWSAVLSSITTMIAITSLIFTIK